MSNLVRFGACAAAVVANTCTVAEFNARSCDFKLRSEPSTQKPRKVATPNFPAGNYRWLIGTYGETDESMSYQFVLSKGDGCPALAGVAPQAASRDSGEASEFERQEAR